MTYNTYFDIGAIVLLALVLGLMLAKPRLKTPINACFISLCAVCLAATVFEAIFFYLFPRTDILSPAGMSMLNVLYILSGNFAAFAFFCYIIALINKRSSWKAMLGNKLLLSATVVPIVLVVAASALNPILKIFGYFDDAGDFQPGGGAAIRFAASFVYILFTIIYIISKHKTLSKELAFKLCAVTGIALVPIFFWFLVPGANMLFFGIAIIVNVDYFVIQQPELNIDGQTGFFNSNAFSLKSGMNYEMRKGFYVIAVRYENAPFIEKTFGVEFMKKITKLGAKYLKSVKPSGSAIFCLRENRIALLCENISDEEAANVAYDICGRYKEDFVCDNVPVVLQTFVQVVKCPTDADNASALMALLDINSDFFEGGALPLFSSKLSFNESNYRRIAVEMAVEHALDCGTFTVHYQPIYSSTSGKVEYAEALARLYDENLGYIMPEEFIPIAEKRRSITRVGYRVFDEVCRFISENDITSMGLKCIEVNLSVVQCMDSELADKLIETTEKYEVDPHLINLEITASTATNFTDVLLTNMAILYNRGFTFVLDNYGVGYTDMRCLTDMPFTTIKIDKSLIWAGDSNSKALVMLESTVQMFKRLNLTIIAEGAETERQAFLAADIGCDYIQGFRFSEPINEENFSALMKNGVKNT